MEYVIDLLWDADAQVWVATSNDIQGLVLESGSFDALIERLKHAGPELIELNNLEFASAITCRAEQRISLGKDAH